MQRTTVVTALVAAVVFAVAGWFAGSRPGKVNILKHKHQYQDCKGKDCDVKIKVDCVDPTQPSAVTCEPYAVDEVILVTPKHKITFTIDDAGYEYDNDGIKFADSNFDCQSQGNQKYKCDIKDGTAPNLYKYSIRLKGQDPVDPWVVNY